MINTLMVTKRDGTKEELDPEKIHKILFWATDGITGVSTSAIEIKANIMFYDGITTNDIHSTLVKASAELVTENVNYSEVAARLKLFNLRKEVFGQYEPTRLYDIIVRNVEEKVYDPELLERYTEEQFDIMDSFIRHDRDDNFSIAAVEQLHGKYLIKNRVTNKYYETPQIMYMLVAAAAFMYDTNRMHHIKKFYNIISTFKIGIATPILAGLRTRTRQFSSCVLIDGDDSLDSIFAMATADGKYVAKRAGLGNNIGRIRPENSEIRGGEARHTGLIPFIKLFKAATKSCSQGGIRGGAMTAYYPVWHYDFEKLIVLKNNKGTEETRERHIDYGVQFNTYLVKRLIEGKDITLFSPALPELYDAFFNDQEKFAKLYEKYEKDNTIMKKKVPASKIFKMFFNERASTGRIYYMMTDLANDYSPFNSMTHPITMSNLCCEIMLPPKPFNDVNDEEGRIQLCTLSNINWGAISSPEEMEEICYYVVRYLDNILELQDYPMIQAKLATEEFRPLGIGVNNLAYFLAKNDEKYGSKEGLVLVDKWMQHQAYYCQQASIALAKERGPCSKSDELLRSEGIMVIDQYKKTVDELVEPIEYLDWEKLREDAKKYGVRNATTGATPPSESNSQIIGATNGIEPPRAPITFKESKDGSLPIVVPSYRYLKNKYEYLWDMKDMKGYLRTVAVLQKYHDQTISTNFNYNPSHYQDNKVPMSVIMEDFLYATKYGVVTGYYHNTAPIQTAKSDDIDDVSSEIIVEQDSDDECSSCIL